MNPTASIVITKSVTIGGNSSHCTISANCAVEDVAGQTAKLLTTMSEAVTQKLDHKAS